VDLLKDIAEYLDQTAVYWLKWLGFLIALIGMAVLIFMPGT
jgi:drug/metabolite transporter superfamily protein YnfA